MSKLSVFRFILPSFSTDPTATTRNAEKALPALPIKTSRFLTCVITIIALALAVFIALLTVIRQDKNTDAVKIPVLVFLIVFITGMMFIRRETVKKLTAWASVHMKALLGISAALFALGFIARFGFLVFTYAPVSDTLQFFRNATALSQGGSLNSPLYVAMYPFLYAYIVLLAGMFDIFGSGLFGIILLNTIADLLSAFMIGYYVKLRTRSHAWQLFAVLVWWLSPYNIIFCALSLPVTLVNTFILVILVLFEQLTENLDKIKHVLILSIAVSLTLAILDALRPISIILIIAIALYYILCCINQWKLRVLIHCVASITILIVLTGILGNLWQQTVNAATGLPANTHKAGWSIYVGSNYGSSGGWTREDNDYMELLLEENNEDYSKTFSILQEEGIERWKRLGTLEIAGFLYKKFIRFAGDAQNMTYNLPNSYPAWKLHETVMNILRIFCAFYWIILLTFAISYLSLKKRDKELNTTVWIYLLIIGLLLSFMATEVANRYFSILFPMFTVLSVFGARKLIGKRHSIAG